MWFGTQEGLNRYDGYEFHTFLHDPRDPSSLAHDSIKAVLVDQEGRLWVGTDGGGLNLLDRATGSFTRFQHDPSDPTSLSDNRVRALHLDGLGQFWVGTDGGGLNRFDPETGRFQRFVHHPDDPSSLGHNAIRSIFRDREGTLWIGSEGGGLDRFEADSETFTHFRHHPEDPTSLSGNKVRAVFEDSSQTLWVGTYESGLSRLDRKTGTFDTFRAKPDDPTCLPANGVRSIFQDRQGILWIGTDEGLLEWRPDTESFVRYQHNPVDSFTLSHNTVLSLFQDAGGVLWVGTFGGLNKWNTFNPTFRHVRSWPGNLKGLSNNYVTSFSEALDGKIWIGTHGGGLNLMDPADGTFKHFRHQASDPRSLSDDRVMSLFSDRGGTLWAGTISGGLNRLAEDGQSFDRFQNDPSNPRSLSSNAVTVVFEDSSEHLWVGTYRGGLNRMDSPSGTFERFRHDPGDSSSLGSDRVLTLLEDRRGHLWVGTDGGGLNRFHPETKTFTSYRHDPDDPLSLSSDNIWSLDEDPAGNLWLGTQGGGLNRWDRKDFEQGTVRFSHFTKRDGLPSGIVNATLWDDSGALWVSTNGGLSKLDPATRTVVNYDASHGLQSGEFNFAAVFRAGNGEMFFGGINGFNSFFPAEIRGNQHPPPVVLTAFLKLNQAVAPEGALVDLREVTLTHQDRVVAFEFSALDYTAPEKNRYMHKLEGFDPDWVDAGTRRRATYTNLDAGQYLFRVKASNNDGLWNEDGLSIQVEALAAPWQTKWAYLFYSLAIGAAVALLLRSQARKLRWASELNRTNEALKGEMAERLAKERALNQEKERAQTYFEVVETLMVALTPSGTVAAINRKGCRVLGYSDHEIIGKDWFDNFVPEKDREEARRRMLNCEEDEYSEHSLITCDQSRRVVAWHTSTLPTEEGSEASVISSGTDITQVRQLEKQLYLSQKMDAIGTLAGGIAHDFNNILQSILGYTIISLETLPAHSETSDYLRRVIKAGERAKKLIGHILTFSHQEKQEHRPIHVQAVVAEALELLRPSLPSNIEIQESIQPDCLPVLADPTQVHQVIMNLCTNAYQAMDGQPGKLTIVLEMVCLTANDRKANPELSVGQNARLTVRDTGQGMERSMLDKIFDPFFTTRKVGSGTGLGLSVVHGIVKGIGGKVFVSSEVGAGSEFKVYLPCCTADLEEETSSEEVALSGRERILVVDDEEDIAEMLGVVLEGLGYNVKVLTSGTEALQAFRDSPMGYDLLITDQTMPGVSGTELAQAAKVANPKIPVIVVSGFLTGSVSSECVDFSMQKPFVVHELGKLVRQALDQRPVESRQEVH
ncbi:MAG: response regulator [Deltaproteobacteria bacterium]|nr:response regulator [Deltaproteobacteria bacterium]